MELMVQAFFLGTLGFVAGLIGRSAGTAAMGALGFLVFLGPQLMWPATH